MDRRILANAIRALSIDAVEKAHSGHPGAPLGMADMAEVLWNDFVNHNPQNANWANRDRVVLSNGHASMLLYSVLHLTGYDLSIDDIKAFRQLHSKTAGHPEYGYAPGIEVTTGLLGQGISMAVGLALGEKLLAAEFNRDGHRIIDHHTYVLVGDGCLMEGISHETLSLAGTWKLNKLIALYDQNGISVDGNVEGWFSEDEAGRFRSYGWNVIESVDGHDAAAVHAAIEQAKKSSDKPTLICCRTTIGYGSPSKAGKESVHGSPLGKDEASATKAALGWSYSPFEIPDEIYKAWDAKEKGAQLEADWNAAFAKYEAAYPGLAAEFRRRGDRKLPPDFDSKLDVFLTKEQPQFEATRRTSHRVLEELTAFLPEMIGGSADLTLSNLTNWKTMKSFTGDDTGGNYLHYGVREFGMSAIMNGLYGYGRFRPFGGTFLVFSDYLRNALRVSALMKFQVIYVLTHDSITLGEDGPTHQPIEQLPSLRLIPDLDVWRPANPEETLAAWRHAMKSADGPTALVLSRANVHFVHPADSKLAERGGYVIVEPGRKPDQLIIATGSELPLAVEAASQKNQKGGAVRVVSMPSVEVFERQGDDYKSSVLSVAYENRFVIEAAHQGLWTRYAPFENIVGISEFGLSAPADDLMKHFGFTVENLLSRLG